LPAAFELDRDGLAARESWLFFDDEYACLGAGITCDSDGPVVTTLNQCHCRGRSVLQP
jgi:chondroitin AC lyase